LCANVLKARYYKNSDFMVASGPNMPLILGRALSMEGIYSRRGWCGM
jgi:hypothetical protein